MATIESLCAQQNIPVVNFHSTRIAKFMLALCETGKPLFVNIPYPAVLIPIFVSGDGCGWCVWLFSNSLLLNISTRSRNSANSRESLFPCCLPCCWNLNIIFLLLLSQPLLVHEKMSHFPERKYYDFKYGFRWEKKADGRRRQGENYFEESEPNNMHILIWHLRFAIFIPLELVRIAISQIKWNAHLQATKDH